MKKGILKNLKVIAVIESKVEMWFENTDINTCIIILEKYDHKEGRDLKKQMKLWEEDLMKKRESMKKQSEARHKGSQNFLKKKEKNYLYL